MRNACLKTAILAVSLMGLGARAADAQTPWRTPPIKNTTNSEVVSCDLLNASGEDLVATNVIINVRTLEGDVSSNVVNVPGPFVIADGRGVRGSSPAAVMPFRTVYCELDPGSSLGVDENALLFTMTFDDGTRKAVTTAVPRAKKK